MKTQKVSTSFGDFAEEWDDKVKETGVLSSRATSKSILESLGNVKNKKIYELACGNGFFSRQIVSKGCKEVWASDIAQEMIDIATEKYDVKGIKYSTREATDFKKIPKNYFNAVIMQFGIFFVKDIDALMKGISKLLKPNGLFIFNIRHPLYPEAKKRIIEMEPPKSNDLKNLLDENEKYLSNYTGIIKKEWRGRNVNYLNYKRPLSVYINTCVKYGLLIKHVEEPKTVRLNKGQVKRTNIPSSLVIETIKKK